MKKGFVKLTSIFILSITLFSCEAQPTAKPSPSSSTASTPAPSASTTPTTDKKADLGKPSETKLSDFVWEEGKLTFKLPETMKEQKSDETTFEASNDAIYFQLIPWKDAKLSQEDVLKEAVKQATNVDFNSFKIDEEASGEYELNGFKGYIAVGETKLKDSTDTFYLGIIAMIDPASDANFISYITINKGKASENEKNLNVAGDILASFKKK
jgi:hypothetical protein